MTCRRPFGCAAAATAVLALAGCGGDVIHSEDFQSYAPGDTPGGDSPGPPGKDANRTSSEFEVVDFGAGQGLQIHRVGRNPELHTYAAVPVPDQVGGSSGFNYAFSARLDFGNSSGVNPDPMVARVRKTPVPSPSVGAVLAEVRFDAGEVSTLDFDDDRPDTQTLAVAYSTGDLLTVSIDIDVAADTYDVTVINTDHRPSDPKDRSDEATGLALGAPLGPNDDRPYLQLSFEDAGGPPPSVFRIDDVLITER